MQRQGAETKHLKCCFELSRNSSKTTSSVRLHPAKRVSETETVREALRLSPFSCQASHLFGFVRSDVSSPQTDSVDGITR